MLNLDNQTISVLTQVSVVIFFAIIIHIVKTVVFNKFIDKIKGKKDFLNIEAFLTSSNTPITLLIYLFSFVMILDIFNKNHTDLYLLQVAPKIIKLFALLIATMFALKFVPKFEKNYHIKNKKKFVKLDKTATTAVSQLTKVGIVILALILAIQTLGYDLTGLLAVGGAGGLIVGLAAKDAIANLLGGFMLNIERPFALGDSIVSNDHKSIMGTVEHIGLRSTRILTLEKKPMYVPNSLFMTITVENTTRMKTRRIKESIGLRYDDLEKLPKICEDIRSIINNHDGVDQEMFKLVNVNEFASSSINILVFAFTKSGLYADFMNVKEDILLQISKVVAKHGADYAFPTVTNHIPERVMIENLNSKTS